MQVVQKKKILMLSDHPLSTSGVGTQARWLAQGLINTGKWTFRCFGGAIKHENYDPIKVNDDMIIKPTNGFGDKNMLRLTLAAEKPDVLLLFTDPRFFIWVWEMEDEIHKVCPIAYNHLWDNGPWPEFNRVLYESTDLINCINHPTYEMVSKRFPERTNYIPHAIPDNIFFPLPDNDRQRLKSMILGPNRADHFTILYVSRNARRKMPSDIIVSFKQFLTALESKYGHRKATLVMHTDPLDPEGPNLHHVIDMLHLKNDIVFSKERIGFTEMNSLYNIGDTIINRSCFVPGTRVVVKDKGYLPIEEVSIGDYVMTHKRRWMPVIDTIRNSGRNKRMLKLSVTNSNSVTCTDDHKLLAVKRSDLPRKFSFISNANSVLDYAHLTPAKELNVGDYVVAANEQYKPTQEITTLSMWDLVKSDTYLRAGHKESSIYANVDERIISQIMQPLDHGPTSVELTTDVAYVLGNWTADGTTHSTAVAFDKRHPDRITNYVNALERGFAMKTNIIDRKNHVEVIVKNGGVLAKLFTKLCGEYSHGKHVPECIKNGTLALQKAYLAGYLAGDGCTLKHPSYGHLTHRIRTVSNAIAYDLRQILTNLDYTPNLYEHSNAHGYNKNGRIWTLEWRDRVGGKQANSSCRSWNVNGVIISRIHKIEETESVDTVYDLTVDTDHTYMVENITVSNCNEGFGLPTLEMMMCGKPIIALKTGGLTRQVEDHNTGEQFGIALEPEVKSLVGNQLVPYIYEDFVSYETVSNAFMKMYEMGPEERAKLGARAREHALKNYNMNNLINDWDRTLTTLTETWREKHVRWEMNEI